MAGALVGARLVNQIQGRWQLTADVIEMPKNDIKSERLRNIRAENGTYNRKYEQFNQGGPATPGGRRNG